MARNFNTFAPGNDPLCSPPGARRLCPTDTQADSFLSQGFAVWTDFQLL